MAALAINIKFVDNSLFDDDIALSKTIASSFNADDKITRFESDAGIKELPSLAQTQSDPIYGSLGPPAHSQSDDFNDEVNFEFKMRSFKKPEPMVDDVESIESLAWAEKSTGKKLEMKEKDAPPPALHSQVAADAMANEDYEEDEDMKATRKSLAASIKINDYTGKAAAGRDWFDCINARNGRCRSDIKKEKQDEKDQEKAERRKGNSDIGDEEEGAGGSKNWDIDAANKVEKPVAEAAEKSEPQSAVQQSVIKGLVQDNSLQGLYAQKHREELDMEDVKAMSVDGSTVKLDSLPDVNTAAEEDNDLKY